MNGMVVRYAPTGSQMDCDPNGFTVSSNLRTKKEKKNEIFFTCGLCSTPQTALSDNGPNRWGPDYPWKKIHLEDNSCL